MVRVATTATTTRTAEQLLTILLRCQAAKAVTRPVARSKEGGTYSKKTAEGWSMARLLKLVVAMVVRMIEMRTSFIVQHYLH